MHKDSTLHRDMIAEAIRSIIDEIVKEHFDALTQEHQVTSRMCGALEARFHHVFFERYSVEIITQEFPDKGPGTLEKITGADLYIGIKVEEGVVISKGLFIQSKWKEQGRSAKDQADLVSQCEKINDRTQAGYLWLYGPNGVDVIPAREVISHPKTPPEKLGSRKINELMRQVLDCFEGDRSYGPPAGHLSREALKIMLREFGVRNGIYISINHR